MKSIFGDRTWVILLALGAVIAIVILAAGLGEMEFGQPISSRLERISSSDFSDLESASGIRWIRYLLPGILLLLLLVILGPVRPQKESSIFSALLRSVGFLFFFTIVFGAFARQSGLLSDEALDGLTAPVAGDALPADFAPPTLTSGGSLWITLLVIAVSGVFVVILVNRAFDRFYKPKTGIDEIAAIARTALSRLSDGNVSKNVIVRCYLDMNHVLEEKREIVREAAATPGEFAARLEALGLPGGAVHGLTGVFERVRYGGKEADPGEVKEAKRCLTEILEACGKKI